MNSSTLIFIILLLALFSYWFAIKHAIKTVGGVTKVKQLTSLPKQFGLLTAFWCGIPALLVLFLWSVFESSVIDYFLLASLSESVNALSADHLSLYLNDIKMIAEDISVQNFEIGRAHV